MTPDHLLRLHRALLLAAIVALLPGTPAGAREPVSLYAVEAYRPSTFERAALDELTFWQSVAAGYQVRHVPEEPYYYIRFTAEDPFEFRIAQALIDAGTGGYLHTWDHDRDPATPAVSLRIPADVLTLRTSLLAISRYWADVCERAGLELVFAEEGPIRVWIPSWLTTPRNSLGLARYHSHELMLWREGQGPAVAAHEYFHLVQGAVSARRQAELWDPVSENNRRLSFLEEVTADWAMDEPIRIPLPNGSTLDLDVDDNSYLVMGSHLFRYGDRPLLSREGPAVGYLESPLTKYFSEQAGGGTDTGSPESVLRWIINSLEDGPPAAPHLLAELAKLLPESFGATWQERWRRFHTAFRMSNVVQKAGAAPLHPRLLGYHDNAFQALDRKPTPDQTDSNPGPPGEMYPLALGEDGILRRDYLRVPPRLYKEAATASERAERLREFADHEAIEPQATLTRLIDPGYPPSSGKDPRHGPVFFFASSDDGASVYLLEQRTRDANHLGRDSARFRWEEDFELEQHPSVKPEAVSSLTLDPEPGERMFLWCGLVNNALDLTRQSVIWTYLASPRLCSRPRPEVPGRTTRTVLLADGDPILRGSASGFFNGDQFSFEVDASGPLHLGPLDRPGIPEEDRTLAVQLVGPGESEVKLSPEGLRVNALQLDERETIRYTISGRIADDNPVSGSCRLRIRLTSLLNLGAGDEEVDESFSFQLRRGVPRIERFRISSGGEDKYDSSGGFHRGIQPTGGTFALDVEITFSEPMDHSRVTVTAGGAPPFAEHALEGLRWDGNRCRGTLRLAKQDAPPHGMLTFAVAGTDRDGTPLDSDAYRDGPQPDTQHFAMLDLVELYRLAIEVQGTHTHRGDHAPGYPEHEEATCDGLRLDFTLAPRDGSHGMRFAGSQCDRHLRTLQHRTRTLNYTHGVAKQELAAARANPAAAVAPQIRKLRTRLNNERAILDGMRKRPELPASDPNLASLEASIARAGRELEALQGDSPETAVVALLERTLKEADEALVAAGKERERLLAAARVTQGIRIYQAYGPAATPRVTFRGARYTRTTEDQRTEVTSPAWKTGEAGAARVQGYSSLTLVVMLASWEDLAEVEGLIREGHDFGPDLAKFLWSFWPERERPAPGPPVVPPLRSNMLAVLSTAGAPSFSFPAHSRTTSASGQVTDRDEHFTIQMERNPKLGRGGPTLGIIPGEAATSSTDLPLTFPGWNGDPLDFAKGNLHLYGQPADWSFDGFATGAAHLEGSAAPGNAADLHDWRWNWRWSLEHVGAPGELRPEPRP